MVPLENPHRLRPEMDRVQMGLGSSRQCQSLGIAGKLKRNILQTVETSSHPFLLIVDGRSVRVRARS